MHDVTYFACSPSFEDWIHQAMIDECDRRALIFESEEGYHPDQEAFVEHIPVELLPEIKNGL